MPIYDTFSRRRDQAAKAGKPEIYAYDEMPEALINQIIMIWSDALREGRYFRMGTNKSDACSEDAWKFVERVFQREHGIPVLYRHDPYSNFAPPAAYRVTHFFRTSESNDHRLDIIELVFAVVFRSDIARREEHIDELNKLFKLSGVGYQFVEGKLVRLDSTVAHEELVKPALVLLGRKGFEKADEQYRSAHDHYRRDEYPQAITQAGKAFESALKAICSDKGWEYSDGARASDLVKVAVKNGLFPEWLDKGITAYVAMISTGLPDVRNNAGAHGTSPDAAPVSAYLARYALHISAANILFVAEAAEMRD
jgi:HEPN domain-containing protein